MSASRHSTAKVQNARVVLMSAPGAAVYRAITIQMIAFVGLKIVAIAARARAARRLHSCQPSKVDTVRSAHLLALEPGCFGSLRKGQSQRAMVVNVVSTEFESVRVEQNHCHGLNTVKNSCSSLSVPEQTSQEQQDLPQRARPGSFCHKPSQPASR